MLRLHIIVIIVEINTQRKNVLDLYLVRNALARGRIANFRQRAH